MEIYNVAEHVRKNPNCNYFISASAGTGKTYTITQYYIGILEYHERFKNPSIVERIVATTFTNKAAAEMRERIMKMVEEKINQEGEDTEYWKGIKVAMPRAIISTIDSFCQRILREENLAIGVDPCFTVISDLKKDRIIERSIYNTLRIIFEIYEDQSTITIPQALSQNRLKEVNKLIEELRKHKEGIKLLFSKLKLEGMQNLLKDTLLKWRTEMKRSKVLDKLVDIDTTAFSALEAYRLSVLIAKEIYESFTIDASEFDFKGVLEKVLDVLENERVREKYRKRFKYIIVDEYQDTNYLQKELFDKLHYEGNYIFYVGDRKQSIYRFRGSDVTVFTKTYNEFIEKKRKGENYKVLSLTTNYRSDHELVEYFNKLAGESLFNTIVMQASNDDEIQKFETVQELFPEIYRDTGFRKEDKSLPRPDVETDSSAPSLGTPDRKKVKYVVIGGEAKKKEEMLWIEAETAAKIVKALVGQKVTIDGMERPLSYKDIVILRRQLKNAEKVYRKTFKKKGIPLYVMGSKSFYNRPEIQAIFSAIKAVQNPDNDFAFVQYLLSPLVGAKFKVLDFLVANRKDDETLFHTCGRLVDSFPGNVIKGYDVLNKYAELKYYIKPTEVLKGMIRDLKYLPKLASLGEEREVAIYNLKKLLNEASKFDQIANSFSELVRLISKITEVDEAEAALEDEESDSVKLMTIHRSKGLEFPVVILGGTYEEIDKGSKEKIEFTLPDDNGKRFYTLRRFLEKHVLEDETKFVMDDFYINDFMNYTEERRLLYVAATRASKLFIPIIFESVSKESYKMYLERVDKSAFDTVLVEEIKIREERYDTLEKAHEEASEDIPEENLRDLSLHAYRKYIAPTFLISHADIKPFEVDTDVTEEKVISLNVDTLFKEERMLEGKRIHQALATVQSISDIARLEREGIIKSEAKLSENAVLKWLFTLPFSRSEWRLVKHYRFKGRDYMLFGVPDRVFASDGNVWVIDYKHSLLRGEKRKKQLEDYSFQLQFYMYLLSDFKELGEPKAGYIVSTITGEVIKVEYDPDFEKKLQKLLESLEAVRHEKSDCSRY